MTFSSFTAPPLRSRSLLTENRINPNFLHIDGNYDHAAPILKEWIGRNLDAVDLAIELENNGWTTLFVDCDFVETSDWLKLAGQIDFFYESYSTSLTMGEIVVCRGRQLIRHLLLDEENPEDNLNVGRLPSEDSTPLESWGDVWGYVDDGRWMKDILYSSQRLH